MKYDLLSVERDAKTKKGTAHGYLTGALFMAPADEADGVHNMCPRSTPECRDGCLFRSGFAEVYPSVVEARIARTLDYIRDFEGFAERLARDTAKLIAEAENRGLIPAERPNATSDQPQLAKAMARRFPSMQFYDYTAIERPWRRTRDNYHLTFSFKGDNLRECGNALAHNINVAVVFRGPKPKTWHGIPVIDGDQHDLRFLDPTGVIVGLRPKGRRIQQIPAGGFVQIGEAA